MERVNRLARRRGGLKVSRQLHKSGRQQMGRLGEACDAFVTNAAVNVRDTTYSDLVQKARQREEKVPRLKRYVVCDREKQLRSYLSEA